MAAFEYQALDAGGRTKKGVVSADSVKAARRELRRQSLTPIKVSPTIEAADKPSGRGGRKLKSKNLVLATRQLAMLISSGSPVEEALAAVAEASEGNTTRSVLASVRAGVMEGRSLSDALKSERKSFPPLYRAVVAAGENAGALGPVMERLADYLEASDAMNRKVVSALIYPAALAFVAIAVIIALLVVVVPQVVEQFDTLGQQLPLLTRIMLGGSEFLRTYGWLLLGGVGGAIFLMSQALKTDVFKRRVDRFVLTLPVLGKVTRSVAAARFSRTFATLAMSGAPVLDCLAAARETTPNLVMRDAVDQIAEAVREGGSLSAAMSRTGAFPPLMTHMAASGEAGGDLGRMFDKGGEYLENEFENISSVALGMLEPMITIIMGGVVMLIILAIMLPILQLNSAALL
ncbi:MAG: type II secretion system inner membrane protein GspF [Pseudomonadota bacterium]